MKPVNLSDLARVMGIEDRINSEKCLSCRKSVRGAYARWTSGVTCSRTCNDKHVERMKEKLNDPLSPG